MTTTRATSNELGEVVERVLVEGSWAAGLALAVTDRDRVIVDEAVGLADLAAQEPVSASTMFEIGSIGKGFTAALLLQARDSGLLDLDEPVTTYLPWFEVQSRFEPITIRHLLTHTAGISRGTEFTGEAAFEVWTLRETEATVAPGTWHYYSNVGYKALGLVLESIYQRPYEQVLAGHLLEPLGMSASESAITHETRRRLAVGYEMHYDDRPMKRSDGLVPATWLEAGMADGSIASTAADMTAWLRMMMYDGLGPDGATVLQADSLREMLTSAISVEQPYSHTDAPQEAYGLGMFVYEIDGRRLVGHTGGMVGYYAAVVCDLDYGLGAVVLANGRGPWEQLARHAILSTRAARSGSEARRFTIPVRDSSFVPAVKFSTPPDEWAPFLGHYRCWNPWMPNVRVQYSEDKLWLWAGEKSTFLGEPLIPLTDGSFRIGEDERGPERIRFDVVLDGKAIRANVSGCPFYRAFTP